MTPTRRTFLSAIGAAAVAPALSRFMPERRETWNGSQICYAAPENVILPPSDAELAAAFERMWSKVQYQPSRIEPEIYYRGVPIQYVPNLEQRYHGLPIHFRPKV